MPAWPEEFDEVLRRFCRFANPDQEIDADAFLVELGVDSLSMLSLIVESEEAFGVVLEPDLLTAEALATPGGFWLLLREQLGGEAEPHASEPAR